MPLVIGLDGKLDKLVKFMLIKFMYEFIRTILLDSKKIIFIKCYNFPTDIKIYMLLYSYNIINYYIIYKLIRTLK